VSWRPFRPVRVVRTLRAAVANLPRGIVGPCRFRSEAGRAVRAAVPVLRCRGFSPRQLPPWCRIEHASSLVRPVDLDRSRRLVTLCVLRLREPRPTRTTSDVLCRSTSASARAPPRVRPAQPVFRQAAQLTRRARALRNRHPVRGDGTMNPGRLRCMGCSTLRSSRALRVRCSACALRSAPFRPIQRTPSPSRECGWLVLPRARSTRPLDLAIADVRKMLPHSPLQPT